MLQGKNLDARVAIVDAHVRAENRRDLEAVMATFGRAARYDDEPWGDHRVGLDEVRAYYTQLIQALPDLAIDIRHRHVSDDAIVLEVDVSGTHGGSWRGLPATGRPVRFPLCGVFTFDEENRLAGERIYYDRAAVLAQLRVFREPATVAGRIQTAVLHPLTIVRAYARTRRA